MNNIFNYLNHISSTALRHSEIIVTLIIVAAVFMLILPLPTGLIDSLIATNICLSTLLIVLVMYLPGPLAFSTFPTILLITTMFRLALTISTTRSILLDQDAGNIVDTFGNLVAGGNLAVGLVIFLIITVAQFLVIAKGSERVAEVAARFTLDAMPGKQMTIDSDLRSEIITPEEARELREEQSKESSLFGALDGAMKFVKGDAIAGLIVVAVNLIGGLSIGILQLDMAAGDAMQVYSILTIGDGLVAQIPALLMSLTAGILITRISPSAKNTTTNVGKEIAEQLLSQPKAWLTASFCILGFSFVPGMPTSVFITVSIITAAVGSIKLWRFRKQELEIIGATQQIIEAPELNGKEDLRSIEFSRDYILQFHQNMRGSEVAEGLIERIRRCRNRLVSTYGLTLPPFDIEYIETLQENEFRFSVYETPIMQATFDDDSIAVDPANIQGNAPEGSVHGRADWEEDNWLWLTEQQCDQLNIEENLRHHSLTLILQRVEDLLFKTGPRFIGLREASLMTSWLEKTQPELGQELQRILPLSRLANILRLLASERVSLRSIRPIADVLVEYAPNQGDNELLVDEVRMALREQICHQHSEQGEMKAWMLAPRSERMLLDSIQRSEYISFLHLDARISKTLNSYLSEISNSLSSSNNIVLLVCHELRRLLRNYVADSYHNIPILSLSELLPATQVKVLGRIDLEHNFTLDHSIESGEKIMEARYD